MSNKERHAEHSATDKEREDTKHQPKGGVIDGVGGMGGSSGAGGARVSPEYVGDVSGIDAEIDTDEIPMPGSTGKGGPSNARAGHTSGGMSGKNRGNSTETEPSHSAGQPQD